MEVKEERDLVEGKVLDQTCHSYSSLGVHSFNKIICKKEKKKKKGGCGCLLYLYLLHTHPLPPPSPFMRLKGEKRNKSNTTLPLSLYSLLFYFLFSHSLSLSHLPPYFNVKKKKAFLTSFSVKKTLLAFYYYTKIGFRGKKVVEATVGRWVKNSGSLSLSLSFDKVKKKWRRMG